MRRIRVECRFIIVGIIIVAEVTRPSNVRRMVGLNAIPLKQIPPNPFIQHPIIFHYHIIFSFSHGIIFISHGIFFFSHGVIFSLTESTELTEFFSLRDFFLPQITQITLILIILFLITRFARDFVLTRHNPNKFGFCSRLLQNSLFDCVKGALRMTRIVTRFARCIFRQNDRRT